MVAAMPTQVPRVRTIPARPGAVRSAPRLTNQAPSSTSTARMKGASSMVTQLAKKLQPNRSRNRLLGRKALRV